jgi:transposase-like protein
MAMPTKFSESLFSAICERLSNGEFLAAICRDVGVSRDTVREWCRQDAELDARFKDARLLGADAIVEDGFRIVDNVEEDPASRRVRSEYRLKALAKWFPQQYGDKVQTEHSGALTLESLVVGARKPE